MIGIFIERLKATDHGIERAVAELRHVHDLLRAPAGHPPHLAPPSPSSGLAG